MTAYSKIAFASALSMASSIRLQGRFRITGDFDSDDPDGNERKKNAILQQCVKPQGNQSMIISDLWEALPEDAQKEFGEEGFTVAVIQAWVRANAGATWGECCKALGLEQSEKNVEKVNVEKVFHQQMDHQQMDHQQMDHQQMDHQQMDHQQMQMNQQMNQRKMNQQVDQNAQNSQQSHQMNQLEAEKQKLEKLQVEIKALEDERQEEKKKYDNLSEEEGTSYLWDNIDIVNRIDTDLKKKYQELANLVTESKQQKLESGQQQLLQKIEEQRDEIRAIEKQKKWEEDSWSRFLLKKRVPLRDVKNAQDTWTGVWEQRLKNGFRAAMETQSVPSKYKQLFRRVGLTFEDVAKHFRQTAGLRWAIQASLKEVGFTCNHLSRYVEEDDDFVDTLEPCGWSPANMIFAWKRAVEQLHDLTEDSLNMTSRSNSLNMTSRSNAKLEQLVNKRKTVSVEAKYIVEKGYMVEKIVEALKEIDPQSQMENSAELSAYLEKNDLLPAVKTSVETLQNQGLNKLTELLLELNRTDKTDFDALAEHLKVTVEKAGDFPRLRPRMFEPSADRLETLKKEVRELSRRAQVVF